MQEITRRNFIKNTGSFSACLAMGPLFLLTRKPVTGDDIWRLPLKLEDLKKTTFDKHLNTKFHIHLDPSDVADVELVETTEAKVKGLENFSIVFRGPHDKSFQQSTYKVEHDKIGSFDLFMVPIGKDNNGIYYEAVFNRLV